MKIFSFYLSIYFLCNYSSYVRIRLSSPPVQTPTAPWMQVYSCVNMSWKIGRHGLGAQHLRISGIRPKRASSWNISLMALPCAQSWRMSWSVSESFSPTPLEPMGRFEDDACWEWAFSSRGGAAGYTLTPVPLSAPGADPTLLRSDRQQLNK